MRIRSCHRFWTWLAVVRLLPTYLLLGLLKHVVPMRWLTPWTWCPQKRPRDREAERLLVSSVLRLSKIMRLSDRDCLQRSLLLYRELSRAGADPTLVAGFHELEGKILGHAWVLVEGRATIESEADLLRFKPALHFGTRGILLQTPATARASWPGNQGANCAAQSGARQQVVSAGLFVRETPSRVSFL
jgi:hypothetical protein